MTFEGRFENAEAFRKFALAGSARFTIVSKATGRRFTYKVRQAKDDITQKPKEFWFVSLLNGPDNDADFAYLGTIDQMWTYLHGRKSRITREAPSAQAISWVWDRVILGRVPHSVEVWHEGSCGRCGRPLTVPASIETGFGPDCAAKMGI